MAARAAGRATWRPSRAGHTRCAIHRALASLRAPLFEEKVVDFLVELADVTEKPVSRERLYQEEDGADTA